jgi:hypothetical protein
LRYREEVDLGTASAARTTRDYATLKYWPGANSTIQESWGMLRIGIGPNGGAATGTGESSHSESFAETNSAEFAAPLSVETSAADSGASATPLGHRWGSAPVG